MATQDYVIGAKLDLRGPTLADYAIIKRQINSGLRGSSTQIGIKINADSARQLKQIRTDIKSVGAASKTSGENIEAFGRRIGIAGKRYLAFSLATVGIVKALGAFRNATSDAIDFEKQIIKIAQVSGRSIQQVSGLRAEILKIGASLGVSSTEISEAAVTLAQTGRPLAEVKKDLEAIAKASLSPTFGNAKDTVEGLIAVQRQFQKSGLTTAEILSKLNSVAGQFPVESADLITATKKTGGAFQAAGGKLEELLALFTSVRSTTRESADTIGTAFRTITGRLGRIKTINFFKDVLDVDLIKDGKILAPFQAIEAIVNGLKTKNIDPKSTVFSSIVEELGGIRQRAKVIPLLLQFAEAQKVLNVAMSSGDSITRDAAQAQEGLGTQITKVRQEFQRFVDNVLKDPAFRTFASELLGITAGLIKVADAARPLIPLVGILGGAFAARSLSPLLRGISPKVPTIKGFAQGGSPGQRVFEGSGKVPGVGVKDSVPALIKPSEFVLKSQAHHKYGTKTLQDINDGKLPANFADDLPKFAKGGSPSDERFPGQRELQKRSEALTKKEHLLDLEEKKNFKEFQETPFYRPFKKRAAKKLAEKNRTELSKVYDEQAKVNEEFTAAIIKKRAKRPGGPLQERAAVLSTQEMSDRADALVPNIPPKKLPIVGSPLQERAAVLSTQQMSDRADALVPNIPPKKLPIVGSPLQERAAVLSTQQMSDRADALVPNIPPKKLPIVGSLLDNSSEPEIDLGNSRRRRHNELLPINQAPSKTKRQGVAKRRGVITGPRVLTGQSSLPVIDNFGAPEIDLGGESSATVRKRRHNELLPINQAPSTTKRQGIKRRRGNRLGPNAVGGSTPNLRVVPDNSREPEINLGGDPLSTAEVRSRMQRALADNYKNKKTYVPDARKPLGPPDPRRRYVAGLTSKKEDRSLELPIGSFKGIEKEVNRLAKVLGVNVKEVTKGIQDFTATQKQEVRKKLGAIPNASFNSRTKALSFNEKTATSGSVREELIHAQDFKLGGKGEKFASEISGTLQNNVVESFLPEIKKEVEKTADKKGLTGKQREAYIANRTTPREVFASVVRRQPENIQAALLRSTTGVVRGQYATNANLKGVTGPSKRTSTGNGLSIPFVPTGPPRPPRPPEPYGPFPLPPPRPSGPSFFPGLGNSLSGPAIGRGLPKPSSKLNIKNPFSLGLGKGGLTASAGVLGAGVLSSGILDDEQANKAAKTLGLVAIQFGILNQALQNSSSLVRARAEQETANIRLQKANINLAGVSKRNSAANESHPV
jgi:TP901 family phage tail tape measure protein